MEVAKYLRSKKSGMKEREGICNGKRIHYFKGSSQLHNPVFLALEFRDFRRNSKSSRTE